MDIHSLLGIPAAQGLHCNTRFATLLLLCLISQHLLIVYIHLGPVPDSVPDFWRMVWEQGTATVVMLTNLEEKGRVCILPKS